MQCKYKVKYKNRTLRIGQSGSNDFTKTATKLVKRNYLKRHKVKEDWTDPNTRGYWARWLLWDKPSLAEAVEKQKKLHTFEYKKC